MSSFNGNSDQIFAIVLVILVSLLGILIILAATRSSAKKKRKGGSSPGKKVEPGKDPLLSEEKKAVLLGHLAPRDLEENPDGEAAGSREKPGPRGSKSIDRDYAEKNGQWVCRYCESINDNVLTICQACGNPRSR